MTKTELTNLVIALSPIPEQWMMDELKLRRRIEHSKVEGDTRRACYEKNDIQLLVEIRKEWADTLFKEME